MNGLGVVKLFSRIIIIIHLMGCYRMSKCKKKKKNKNFGRGKTFVNRKNCVVSNPRCTLYKYFSQNLSPRANIGGGEGSLPPPG